MQNWGMTLILICFDFLLDLLLSWLVGKASSVLFQFLSLWVPLYEKTDKLNTVSLSTVSYLWLIAWMYTRSRVYTGRVFMNRVTDVLPAVSAISESRENKSDQWLPRSTILYSSKSLNVPFLLTFQRKRSCYCAYWFWFLSGDSPKLVSIKLVIGNDAGVTETRLASCFKNSFYLGHWCFQELPKGKLVSVVNN